jgi:exodeoxyribonuclease V alpha subunit
LELWPGDRVMHLRNDYRKGVFNGEIGKVAGILAGRDGEPCGFLVEYDDGDVRRLVEYGRQDCFDVALAYAATVHKAQGCEFPAVCKR